MELPYAQLSGRDPCHIKNIMLGDEEGAMLGWMNRAHPVFSFHDDINEIIAMMMGQDCTGTKYALFPRKIKYKHIKEGAMMLTTGVTMQVVKSDRVMATVFCSNMVGEWQQFEVKSGGKLFRKRFIPFGKGRGLEMMACQLVFTNKTNT
jgi:hypothetical protein